MVQVGLEHQRGMERTGLGQEGGARERAGCIRQGRMGLDQRRAMECLQQEGGAWRCRAGEGPTKVVGATRLEPVQ